MDQERLVKTIYWQGRYYRFHHIHGIQDKHPRVDAEGHCHVLKGVAHWDDGRGWLYTRHVPAEDPLAGINDLCAHHGVSTHYYCSGVSRNILGAGGHILWLGEGKRYSLSIANLSYSR